MVKGKKGVFYTITAMLLIAVFLFAFLSITKYKYSAKALVIDMRISSLNDFIKDTERDIQRAAYISSFRSVISMMQVIVTDQTFIDDVDLRFEGLFFNGTYDGETISFMDNNSFYDWEQKISIEASKLDIEIRFRNKSIVITQEDPWSIQTKLNLTLIIADSRGTANFTKDYEIISYVPIEFLEDPIYRINTNGLLFKSIKIQNNTQFVNGNDTTNLQIYINETKYISFGDAPSYLKRLEGDLSSDVNGIESLVNKDELSLYIAVQDDISSVDYLYFGSSNVTTHKIQGMNGNFKMDNESNGTIGHLDIYMVNELIE